MFKKRENVADIEEGSLLSPKFDKDGLIPVITTDFQTKEVYNKHSRISKLDPQSTYENWPQIFKHIYNIALTKFDIKENYISLGYKL